MKLRAAHINKHSRVLPITNYRWVVFAAEPVSRPSQSLIENTPPKAPEFPLSGREKPRRIRRFDATYWEGTWTTLLANLVLLAFGKEFLLLSNG